jgi:tetratricopeptide (TPR) repeat protein
VYDEGDPHVLLGYVYTHQGRYDEAIAEFQAAVAIQPGVYESRGALARVYRDVGRREKAAAQDAIADEIVSREDKYERARLVVVRCDVEGAQALLEAGLTKGQKPPGQVRIEPEFAFIKDDPRFKALVGNGN